MRTGIALCHLSKDLIYQEIYSHAHSGFYVSYLRGNRCPTEESFFREVSASFQFPWYFGENWAAFDECICDLEWLKIDSIFMVIDDFSSIFNRNESIQNTLIKYLSGMVEYWQRSGIPVEIWLNN